MDEAHVFAGASGATLDRPGLAALRQAVAGMEVARVIVSDDNRLARYFVLSQRLTAEFAAQGCTVVCATPPRAPMTRAAALAGRLRAGLCRCKRSALNCGRVIAGWGQNLAGWKRNHSWFGGGKRR